MASDIELLALRLEELHGDVSEIKAALSKLSDAITSLALVQQQQTQMAASLGRAFKAIERIEERLDRVESNERENNPLVAENKKWIDRAVVGLVTASAIFVAKKTGIL